MKQFLALIYREFREWRTVFIIVVALFGLGLLGSAWGLHKAANYLENSTTHVWDNDDDSDFFDDDEDLDDEWLSPSEMFRYSRGFNPQWLLGNSRPDLIIMAFSFMVISSIGMINGIFILLAFLYLIDAVYKERNDGSTYFYRSLPIHDGALLGSKLVAGTFGLLLLSWVLCMISVLWARITFPGYFTDALEPAGMSLSQIEYTSLGWDWLIFNIVEGLWFLPYAAYLLAVSTMVRSRPLLAAIGIPFVIGLLLNYFYGTAEPLLDLLSSNVVAIGRLAEQNIMAGGGLFSTIKAGESLDLFGSYSGAILSLRTAVSLIVSAGIFGITFVAYRRNMATSA